MIKAWKEKVQVGVPMAENRVWFFTALSLLVLFTFATLHQIGFEADQSHKSSSTSHARWTAGIVSQKEKTLRAGIRSSIVKRKTKKTKGTKLHKVIRFSGVFHRKNKMASEVWANSSRGNIVHPRLLNRWSAAIEKQKIKKGQLSWSLISFGKTIYWVASYLENRDDGTEKIHSALVRKDWLVPALSRTLAGENQILVLDSKKKVHFSDQISIIGSSLNESMSDSSSGLVPSMKLFTIAGSSLKVSSVLPVISSENSAVSIWIRWASWVLLFGAFLALLFNFSREKFFSETLNVEPSEELPRELVDKISNQLEAVSRYEEEIKPRKKDEEIVEKKVEPEPEPEGPRLSSRFFDSLVVALVALKAAKKNPRESHLEVLEEQLRSMKAEVGGNFSELVDDGDEVDVGLEVDLEIDLDDVEEDSFNMQEEKTPGLPVSIPEVVEKQELESDSKFTLDDVVIRSPRITPRVAPRRTTVNKEMS